MSVFFFNFEINRTWNFFEILKKKWYG
jgi:hypothetical protein